LDVVTVKHGQSEQILKRTQLFFRRARIVLVARRLQPSMLRIITSNGICQNASHRLVVQTAKFVFCLHNISNCGAIQTERLGLVIEGVVPAFDQRIRNELNWDSPASAI